MLKPVTLDDLNYSMTNSQIPDWKPPNHVSLALSIESITWPSSLHKLISSEKLYNECTNRPGVGARSGLT